MKKLNKNTGRGQDDFKLFNQCLVGQLSSTDEQVYSGNCIIEEMHYFQEMHLLFQFSKIKA